MRKRIAREQALWYEEELNKEIEKDRLAHGKRPLKKKMIISRQHQEVLEVLELPHFRNQKKSQKV